VKLSFCAACGSTSSIEHHHLVPRAEGSGDDRRVPLCAEVHERSYRHGDLVRAGKARAAAARAAELAPALKTARAVAILLGTEATTPGRPQRERAMAWVNYRKSRCRTTVYPGRCHAQPGIAAPQEARFRSWNVAIC
jgi:hypothetical protein